MLSELIKQLYTQDQISSVPVEQPISPPEMPRRGDVDSASELLESLLKDTGEAIEKVRRRATRKAQFLAD